MEMPMKTCSEYVNLGTPVRSERVRDFQPPWRTVFVYRCGACGSEFRMRAGAFSGTRAVPGVGAVRCAHPVAS